MKPEIYINKKGLRGQIFKHLDGIVTVPVIVALNNAQILNYLSANEIIYLQKVSNEFKTNAGYLNVALRILASQGFLLYEIKEDVTLTKTPTFSHLLKYANALAPVMESLQFSQQFNDRFFEKEAFKKLTSLLMMYQNDVLLPAATSSDEAEIRQQLSHYIEGCLVGPIIVRLGMNGMFHKYFMESSFKAEEFHTDPESFEVLLDFFVHLGWFHKKNGNYSFTDSGLFFARRATSYGVTVSYLPTLTKMNDILFNKVDGLMNNNIGEQESHVDRAMNVWGSGGAHAAYFKAVDELIIEIFNRPIEEQPKGILDMGCGNGALLEHLFYTIENRTLRGKYLETYPLFLVGADYNQAALKITRANLVASKIWAKVIWGDIGNPSQLAADLKEEYNIKLSELLNMRSFLDHNRVWEQPIKTDNLPTSLSTGAYATKGQYIANEWVEQSLVEHFQKWKPYISQFGLLVIELHTLPPAVTAQNLGLTAATAYDATHGFSDQYILEIDVFQQCIQRAGLQIDHRYTRIFPEDERANVSIHLIK